MNLYFDKVYHLSPINDEKEHYIECVYPSHGHPYCPCECEPYFLQKEDELWIVHNSFDGREGIEEVNRILGY